MIDTGAFISAGSRSGAEQLGLRAGSSGYASWVKLRGVGGEFVAPLVTVHELGLGHGLIHRLRLPMVGYYSQPVDGLPVLGLFGDDFLSNYDVDVDLPRQHFGLYRPTGCDAAMRPFDPPYFEVPFRKERSHITLDIRLNDRPIVATLDTGAAVTVIDRNEVVTAGVPLGSLRVLSALAPETDLVAAGRLT